MKKIFLPILILTLLCGWAFAGLTVDKNVDLANKRAAGKLEMSKQSDVGARVTRVAPAADALISVSEDVTPVSNGKIRFNNANYVLKNTVPTTATVLFQAACGTLAGRGDRGSAARGTGRHAGRRAAPPHPDRQRPARPTG